MKKIMSIIAVSVIAVFATANKNYQNSGKMVYRLSGDNYYHLTAEGARSHAIQIFTDKQNAKVYMQLEQGAQKAHLHLCPVCELSHNHK